MSVGSPERPGPHTPVPVDPLTAASGTAARLALLASIVESSGDAIVSKDLDGVITSWNRGAQRLFGYSAEEAVGRSITILLPPDRLDEEPTILSRIRRGERIQSYETVRRRKDGTLLDISLTVSPVVDPHGRIIGASKIARDITQRKRIEQKLAESEERYRRLAQLLPAGVYTCEAPSGRVTYFNDHAVQIWGRVPNPDDSEVRLCGSARLFRPDGTSLLHRESPMAAALAQGRECRNEEVVVERPDGSLVPVLVNIDPIRDAEGTVVGAIAVLHDLSELKKVGEALREQKENLQTLLETLPIGVLIAQDRHGRRITGNRTAAKLLRRPERSNLSKSAPPEEAGVTFRILRNGRPIPDDDLPVQRAARGEKVRSEEVDIEFDDGVVRTMLVSAQPLFDPDGEPRGSVASMLDITDLKQSERALREADRRKDEFLAILAHELRNPLAPILTGLEVMKLAAGDTATVARIRDTMERQAQQLVALVDDLLDVSRITRGKFELRRSVVDLADVIRTAVEASRAAIEQAGQELDLALSDEAIRLRADPNRLAQVLSNLLNNASKYTPAGGRISLQVERSDGAISISVRDTGVGVPEDMLEGIFEMFSQVDRPHEKGQTGLGIGLTLARSLVEMHGGSISARSAGSDRGSTFTVRLPDLSDEALREAPAPEAPMPGSGIRKRVLVVDDNEAAAHTVGTMVEMLGHEVRTAPDGRKAIEAAAEFRPDVVLMDLGMPGMTGYEAAGHIRDASWGREVTLVALTGWGQEEHKRRTEQAGFDHHLVKPATAADLRRLIAGEREAEV